MGRASLSAIRLPKGGGALHGIGETFSPDLHTGTANFTIPIALPEGRNGFHPRLQIGFSTGNGNGPFGLGWRLVLPCITRRTSKGVPRYREDDVFVYTGTEDLVPVPDPEAPDGARAYRPRTEGLFARIRRHRGAGDDYWRVEQKDGTVHLFGTPGHAGGDPACVADPESPGRVFEWKLVRSLDPFGNRIDYEYERDLGSDGPRRWNQLYPARIRYVDYGDPAAPSFLVHVLFHWDERPDAFSDHRPGFEVRTTRRCRQIEVRHGDPPATARTVTLRYLDEEPEARTPVNGVSLLREVMVEGIDGPRTQSIAPLRLDYTAFDPGQRRFLPITGPELPPESLAHPQMELVDLFGNGLPSLLRLDGLAARYWRNLGGGRFDRPRDMPDAPAGLSLADPDVVLLDADGDGRADLLISAADRAGYFPLRFDGLWDRRSFQRYERAPSVPLKDPDVRLIDLDGDGVTDLLRAGARFECFFQDRRRGWVETRFVERSGSEVFPDVSLADPRVRVAALAGGGLQDLALIHDGLVEYWPNQGHGRFGPRVRMHASPRFPEGYDPRRILLGDVDGDGLADLIYVDDRRVTLWINRSGNGWSEPIAVDGTPPVTDVDAIRLVDLLGTGVAGVLWSADAGGPGAVHLFFLDFTGGAKPYLLREIDNRLGTVTRVAYAPSTAHYLADQKGPLAWKTPLPFPVQVVERVEVLDRISGGKLTSEYRYHHGYWDGAEREFRGFGRVDKRDSETFDDYHAPGLHAGQPFTAVAAERFAPASETRTWFHQGPIGDETGAWEEADLSAEHWPGDPSFFARPPAMALALAALPRRERRDALRALRGRVLRSELYALDGGARQDRPYVVRELLHGVAALTSEVFVPLLLGERTAEWERGDEPLTRVRRYDDHDAFGQPRIVTEIAVPRGRDFRAAAAPGDPYLATVTRTRYAEPAPGGPYVHDRVASVARYAVANDGALPLADLHRGAVDGSLPREILDQTLRFFDGAPFVGLPLGALGAHGVEVRVEQLAFTEEILLRAYGAVPAYLAAEAPAWPAEYPTAFGASFPPLAGYVRRAAAPGVEAGWYAVAEQRRYDVQDGPAGQGLVVAQRDALGDETLLEYEPFGLAVERMTGPTGLVTTSELDVRTFQPRAVTSPNGHRTLYRYTPLGLLEEKALVDRDGGGDSADAPSERLIYDLTAYHERGEPVSLRKVRRLHHAGEAGVDPAERDAVEVKVEFSDGLGRVIQARQQTARLAFGDPSSGDAGLPADGAPPDTDVVATAVADAVAVSGLKIHDNKGRVIEEYEPFFDRGLSYTPPASAPLRGGIVRRYDARGRMVRQVRPDGSETRFVLGVPAGLGDPDHFVPTPWETFTYDANDNAGRTHPVESAAWAAHRDTPASSEIDALGRVVLTVERNGPDPGDRITVRSRRDLRGNVIETVDALGRTAFRHVYDLLDRALRVEQLDAGVHTTVLDAGGSVIERRDAKGALELRSDDPLRRPARVWARDNAGEAVTLRERLVYGDGADSGLAAAGAAAANLLGRLWRHYDEAGLLEARAYDFKGNLVERERRAIADAALLAPLSPPPAGWQIAPFRVDWEPPAGTSLDDHAAALLDSAAHVTTTRYDALDRPLAVLLPAGASGARRELGYRYGAGGALEEVRVDGAVQVEHVAYDASGRRILVVYGNGVLARYAYNPSHTLARARSERFTRPVAGTWRTTGAPLDDVRYEYDLIGNVLAEHRPLPGSGAGGAGPLHRQYGYDPLYRLVSATGRECSPTGDPWSAAPACADPAGTRAYTEIYQHDAAGNLERLQRTGAAPFTRVYTAGAGNRVASMQIGALRIDYSHDACGNLIAEGTSRHFEPDHRDRVRVSRVQVDGSEPSLYCVYLYDANGTRVKKLVRRQSGPVDTTLYLDGQLEIQRRNGESASALHVLLGERRAVVLREGAALDDASPAAQYFLADHLGSAALVVDGAGAWISREEHSPFGETTFGSYAAKRYRFGGKERDGESGLCYFGARYYAPWLGRWWSPDPLDLRYKPPSRRPEESRPESADNADAMLPGAAGSARSSSGARTLPWHRLNLYVYARGNPVTFIDPLGLDAAPSGGTGSAPAASSSGGGFWAGVGRVFAFIWNWILAPVVRMVTNAAVGFALGFAAGFGIGTAAGGPGGGLLGGIIGGIIGGALGAVTGGIHGWSMAYAGTYNWRSAGGWFAWLVNNTWSLPNSFLGSFFLTIQMMRGLSVDRNASQGTTALVLRGGGGGSYATTVGNVMSGGYTAHEAVHVLQQRIFGPLFLPLQIASYAINTVLPYWLIYHDYNNYPINSFGRYFTYGVYPHSWFEEWAYAATPEVGPPPR